LDRDGTGDRLDDRLEAKLDGEEHSDSSRLLFEVFSLSQSSLMMIMFVVGDEVISTSSSELPSDDLMLLLSSLDTRNVSLFFVEKIFTIPTRKCEGKWCLVRWLLMMLMNEK